MSGQDTVWREVRDLGRERLQELLEGAGFGVYDSEPMDDLVVAWVEHCQTEGIDPLGDSR